jgi:hypothetical protein
MAAECSSNAAGRYQVGGLEHALRHVALGSLRGFESRPHRIFPWGIKSQSQSRRESDRAIYSRAWNIERGDGAVRGGGF